MYHIAAARSSKCLDSDPVVKITLGNQEMCSSADDTAMTTMTMLTPSDEEFASRDCEDITKLQVATHGMGYDKLDFNRPIRQLKPHYTSSTTLQSVKSTMGKSSREGGDGSSDDAQTPKEDADDNGNKSTNTNSKPQINPKDDGYIECADLVRRHVRNSRPPSTFIISDPQSNNLNSLVPSSQGIIVKVSVVAYLCICIYLYIKIPSFGGLSKFTSKIYLF